MTKLRPRAKIVRTIGDQLISGPEAAMIELVKNAYDADSKVVGITIVPRSSQHPKGRILIQDHGHGMTYNDVVNRWFEPATDEKVKLRRSPGGRALLGAKGIGRFAASRLGARVEMVTVSKTKAGKYDRVSVSIDWDSFSADRYLDEVDIPITRKTFHESPPPQTGLTLKIEDLRDEWTKKRIEVLVRELRRVSSPTDDGDQFDIHLDLTSFTEARVGFSGPELLAELNASSDLERGTEVGATIIRPFRTHGFADYKLIGTFSKEGAFDGKFSIERGDRIETPLRVPAPTMLPDEAPCGAVELSISVCDREAESVQALFERAGVDFGRIGIRAARSILSENAGVSIFRNKFRIRPYGEPENDWLELERQRVQNPSKKLGITQVSGRVLIAGEAESGLIERSSREGLEHNGAFERLKHLLHGVFLHIEDRRFDFREKAGISRKAAGDMTKAKDVAGLRNLEKAIASAPVPDQPLLRQAIEKDRKAIAESLEELEAYQKLLESRVSLGFLVARVIHEGRRYLSPMTASSRMLSEQKDELLSATAIGQLARKQLPAHLETISSGVKNLGKLFKQLDPISGRRRGRPTNFKVEPIISAVCGLFQDAFAASRIDVAIDLDASLSVYGYPEDLHFAVINLLENAVFWLNTVDGRPREIRINGMEHGSMVRIAVENNGPEIDEAYVPRLFTAGFSLKSDGTGIGLTIAREACRGSKGNLLFDASAVDTRFVIELPSAT